MASYLVTGGAGFIGSHLAEELVRRGRSRPRRRQPDHRQTRATSSTFPSVEFLEGDLADLAVAQRAVAGMDYVLHQAAIPSVPRSVNDPITSNRANIDATLNVLVAARDAGVKRLVYRRLLVGVRQHADAAEARGHAAEPAVAVRAAEAGGRAVLPDVHAAVRLRNRDHALFQRVRSAAGSRRRRTPASSRCSRPRCSRGASRRFTATASRRATSPTSPTSSTACCAPATRRRRPAR